MVEKEIRFVAYDSLTPAEQSMTNHDFVEMHFGAPDFVGIRYKGKLIGHISCWFDKKAHTCHIGYTKSRTPKEFFLQYKKTPFELLLNHVQQRGFTKITATKVSPTAQKALARLQLAGRLSAPRKTKYAQQYTLLSKGKKLNKQRRG